MGQSTRDPINNQLYRAVDEERAEDDDTEEHGAGGLDHLEVAVFVGEEDHDGEAADDDELEDEEDAPQDDVEGHDTRGAVLALVTALGTGKALECLIQIVQGHVGALEHLECLLELKQFHSTVYILNSFE